MRETREAEIVHGVNRGRTSQVAYRLRTLRERVRRLLLGNLGKRALRTLDTISRDPEAPLGARVAAARGLVDAMMRCYAAGGTDTERRPILDMIRQASEAHAQLRAHGDSAPVRSAPTEVAIEGEQRQPAETAHTVDAEHTDTNVCSSDDVEEHGDGGTRGDAPSTT